MGKIAVVTDSNSGITQEQAKEYGVNVLPMPFFINGETYFEDIDLTQEQFYEKLEKYVYEELSTIFYKCQESLQNFILYC